MRGFRLSLTAIALICGWSIETASAKEIFKIDPDRSTIRFNVRQYLGTVSGRFSEFSGVIDVDREQPEKSSVTSTIQVKSIDTRIAKRDEHLRSAEFFDVAKFPEITFKSRRVKRTGPNSSEIAGDFTMHGVTKPISLEVKLLTPSSNERATRWQVSTAPLSRREFDLRFSRSLESVSMISDRVSVEIEIEATKAR
jgi:polyisoprenoid-binding protein YceI